MAEASSPHGHQGEGGRGQGPNSPFEGMPSDLRRAHFKRIKSLVSRPEGTLQI